MTNLPSPAHKPIWKRIDKLFLIVVVIPTLASSVYFGLIASDVYISQSKFVIYNPQTPIPSTGLTGLLQGVGLGNNSSYAANAVHDYLLSRDALRDLQTTLHYKETVTKSYIDPFNRFGGWIWFDKSFEQLYRYYLRMTSDDINTTTNISTLTIDAYTARDARRINEELLRLAQLLINKLNRRANRANVAFYKNQVNIAESTLLLTAERLAQFQNHSGVFSPIPQANLRNTLIASLEKQQLTTSLQLNQLHTTAPTNPLTKILQKRLDSLQKQISAESRKVAGGEQSLATRSITYDKLQLRQNLAQKQLISAVNALEEARIQAQKQQLFLETIVKPNTPDEAIRPQRWRSFLATLLISLLTWGVFSVIFAGIREHHER